MQWFGTVRDRLAHYTRELPTSPPVRPRSWPHRHRLLLSLIVVVLAAGSLAAGRPWENCGAGLRSVGSPHVCVGLNIDSGPLRDNDPLAELEGLVKRHNDEVKGDFKTIVVLENLAPDEKVDSQPLEFVRREIQGSIAAAWPKNGQPGIKLLLANYGSNGEHWRVVAEEIIAASASQHIVAVTAVGISVANTRNLVAELSQHGIATIGATVTADNMNTDTNNARIANFFRVGPTNTDEARAAAGYITDHGYRRVMLIEDTSKDNTYAATLAAAFRERATVPVGFTKKYEISPLPDVSREGYLRKLFSGWHSDICSAQPDLIYFAGRGVDLGAFVTSLAEDGACEQLRSVTVMTGDDASTLAGDVLPLDKDIGVQLRYTALAYPGQWGMFTDDPAHPTYARNYDNFVAEFTGTHRFPVGELWNGAAMIQHDAVAVAVRAATESPSADPGSISNFLRSIDCNSAVPGATGFLAFEQGTGNQIDKAMPILSIASDGSVHPVDLVWSRGRPLDTSPTCGK
jgi:ABC-type branched-subunit amino acid transport system substrate-binding protein